MRRLTIEDMVEIARGRGGKCLSKEYATGKNKLKWECAKGHIWEANSLSVKGGSWCPFCAGNIRLSIKDLHETARVKGGKCLSKEYVNNRTKIKWECGKAQMLDAPKYSISGLKGLGPGNYSTEGFVVKKYTCPPCPQDMLCKPCMRDNIVISENDDLVQGYDLTENELIIFTNEVNQFQLGKKYTFYIQITGLRSTSEPVNDVELLGYKK